jgi:hypothetical protein
MFIINKLEGLVILLLMCARPVGAAAVGGPDAEPTLVTPHMEVPMTAGQNVVYCSTFQLAWNDMKNDIVKEDIRLERSLPLVRHLNRGRATRSDISERDYFAVAGPGGDELVDTVNRTLREKFGRDAPQIGGEYRDAEIILAYAFLRKNLRFARPFNGFTKPVTFFTSDGKIQIEGFGIDGYPERRHRTAGEQVEIVDYKDYGNFIIRLASTHPDDEIVLASVPRGGTLRETYEDVNSRVERSAPRPMEENDVLVIPRLNVSIRHSYSPLLGLYLMNKGFEEYFVDEARQDIDFRMDEYGVTVDSEARFVIEKKGPPPDHKLLVFNKPFMLYLKKKDGTHPYFVVWVENEELMIPGG